MYHSIDEKKAFHKYKWLDYRRIAEIFTPRSNTIVSVNYFTAYQCWKPDSFARHKRYVTALETRDITVILGKYKSKSRKCKDCGFISDDYHEEKQTDVNIALCLLRDAFLDKYDTAILCSADSDLVPIIAELKSMPKPKKIGILFPIHRYSNELKGKSDFHMQIKEIHLASCQLPDPVIFESQVISNPTQWD